MKITVFFFSFLYYNNIIKTKTGLEKIPEYFINNIKMILICNRGYPIQ